MPPTTVELTRSSRLNATISQRQAMNRCRALLWKSYYRHGKSSQLHVIAAQSCGRRRPESCGLIYGMNLPSACTHDRNFKRPISLVNQQHAPLPVTRDKCERVDIGMIWPDLYELIARAKVVMKKFEHPVSRVRLAIVPVDHRNAGKATSKAIHGRNVRFIDSSGARFHEALCIVLAGDSREAPSGVNSHLQSSNSCAMILSLEFTSRGRNCGAGAAGRRIVRSSHRFGFLQL